MAAKSEIYRSAAAMQARIAELREVIAQDPELQRRGGVVFPHYTIGANLDPIFELLARSGHEALLSAADIRYIGDVGCGNGELSFLFADCGYHVTAIDYSDAHNQAPYILSQLAARLRLPLAVVDFSVDQSFRMADLRSSCIQRDEIAFPLDLPKFDFIICVGLLYHLRNPFAFIESLARITRHCVLGTWIFTHLSANSRDMAEDPVVYLLDDGELNADPSNYWIFTEASLSRLCRRCGFEVLGTLRVANNDQGIGTPSQLALGMRGFFLLRSLIKPA